MLVALGAHPWAYPRLEVVHIIGVALILGNLVLLELRVFGWAAELPIEPLARLSLGLAGLGFGLLVGIGSQSGPTPQTVGSARSHTLRNTSASIWLKGLRPTAAKRRLPQSPSARRPKTRGE